MDCDTLPREDAREEQAAPADAEPTELTEPAHNPAHDPARSTLAALLGLTDEDLAEPLSRVAPPEHRWEQLTLGDASDSGGEPPAGIRSGAATQPPTAEQELIPGLDAPGAVEVPVYLAGRALRELLEQQEEMAPVLTPAIKVEGVGRLRKSMPAPTANFVKAEHASVLWPKSGVHAKSFARSPDCTDCGAPTRGGRCVACGAEVAPTFRTLRRRRSRGGVLRTVLELENRLLRTLATLVLVPGELTRVFLAGHRRRYLSPVTMSAAAMLLFAVASALGGLRPRPDRALSIGIDHTVARPAGLVDQSPVNLAVEAPMDVIRDLATALEYIPLLWFPLMVFGVVAVAAAVHTFVRSDNNAELVFAAHFASWFVLCWGVFVPGLLLMAKVGFESGATWEGVTRVRQLGNGRVEGLSTVWNDLRQLTISPHFHSALLAMCLVPWAIIAWQRVFATSWAKAVGTGLLIASVPLVLLLPFA